MPYVSLIDLIDSCPAELEAGSIIMFDWCHWILTTMPQWVSCEDLQWCFDCERLMDLISFSWGLLVDPQACRIWIDLDYINANIIASFNCNTMELVVWTTTLDLSCIAWLFTFAFSDWLNVDRVTNGETITVQWLHGLQMIIGTNLIQVDLPSGATAGQVLTRNATNEVAYWANPLEICCDQIQACMAPIIAGIQSEINLLSLLLCPCEGWGTGSLMDIFDEGILVHPNVQQLNFVWACFDATRNSLTNQVDVTLATDLSFDCNTFELSLCGQTADLSCLATINTITVRQTVFVMKNGNDGTGQPERFDKPYLTVQAAIQEAAAAGPEFNVIVYTWYYQEIIELKNNVNVYFHKWCTIQWITTHDNNTISKVTGHVVILAKCQKPAWFGIAVLNNSCQIEIDADKIVAIENCERYYLVYNSGLNSKLRVRLWSVETDSHISWQVTLVAIENEFASIDLVHGVRQDLCPKHNFYTVRNRWELYRHHSQIIQRTAEVTRLDAYVNDANNYWMVYIDNVFIKGNYSASGMDTWRFRSTDYSNVKINDLIMDLYPRETIWSKSVIFLARDNWAFNFYGLTQVRWNNSRDICFTDANVRSNCFWRLLSDKTIQWAWFIYSLFNSVRTYEQETHLDIPPFMPFDSAYDNA